MMAAGLCLMLGAAPGWAGGHPAGNDNSDSAGNTGGGTNALVTLLPGARNNTAYGSSSLFLNRTGIDNTAFGSAALQNNTAGDSTAVGSFALFNNTSGGDNTAVGFHALWQNFVGLSNTAVGSNALANNNSSGFNTAVGALALELNTSGALNTAFGERALINNSSGSQNTAIGSAALINATGSNNIGLGVGAGGLALTSGTNNIYLGAVAPANESNTTRLGQTQTRTFVAGIAGTPVGGSQVLITSTGQLGILASSARYKRDISAIVARSRGLFVLRPVTFRYKQDPQRIRQYGLIAEEVAKVYPELVTRRSDGTIESVQYHELIPMLVNELQRQQRELTELKAQSARLQAALPEQTATRLVRLEKTTYTAPLASR
jgi:Chaperone of endosialidase